MEKSTLLEAKCDEL